MHDDRAGSDAARQPDPWLPGWALAIGAPVWITGTDQRVEYVNRHAEELLGDRDGCRGKPCYEVVAGRGADGRRLCHRRCAVQCAAERGEELEPQQLRLRDGRWLRVLVIPVEAPDRTMRLVHCTVAAARQQRVEDYLRRVADRSSRTRETRARLTRRELEILDRLARDEDLPMIAKRLFVSHATVRNHVQHILAKLGAHSILESIALHLLGATGSAHGPRAPRARE
jgi:DNA-binding CsgD family transcriptional regulator